MHDSVESDPEVNNPLELLELPPSSIPLLVADRTLFLQQYSLPTLTPKEPKSVDGFLESSSRLS
jgi:hypothetical protein